MMCTVQQKKSTHHCYQLAQLASNKRASLCEATTSCAPEISPTRPCCTACAATQAGRTVPLHEAMTKSGKGLGRGRADLGVVGGLALGVQGGRGSLGAHLLDGGALRGERQAGGLVRGVHVVQRLAQ